jgi:hypothetical protein
LVKVALVVGEDAMSMEPSIIANSQLPFAPLLPSERKGVFTSDLGHASVCSRCEPSRHRRLTGGGRHPSVAPLDEQTL